MPPAVQNQIRFAIVLVGGGLLVLTIAAFLYLLLLIAFVLILNIQEGFADNLAILLCGLGSLFGFRQWWRYAAMRSRAASQGARNFKMTVCLALVGAVCAGCLVVVGTLLLGHMRPMWLEVYFAGPAALGGLAVGGLIGLAFDLL